MDLREIPVPPTARKEALEGSYEVALRNASSEVLRELQKKYGASDAEIYFISPDTDWNGVRDFYEDRFGPSGLKRDASFPEEHVGYRLAVWAREGWFSKAAVAVALIDTGTAPNGARQKFLAVFRAGD